MTELNRRRFLRLVGLVFFNGVLLVTLLGLTFWAAGAFFFTFPLNEFRGLAAAIYALAVLVVLVAIRPLWKGAVTVLGLCSSWYLPGPLQFTRRTMGAGNPRWRRRPGQKLMATR